MIKKRFYWLDKWKGAGKGGLYWRGFEFVKFINEAEEKLNCKIVGIKIDDSYNIEFIREELEEENEQSEEKTK